MECILETKATTVLQFIQGLRGSLRVTFEEGTCAAWLHDLLKPHVTEVLVCNPRKNALLKVGNKSDRIDARKLADLLHGGHLSSVYHGENGAKHANCERGGGMRQKKLLCSIFLILSIGGGLSRLAGTQGQKREPEKTERKPLPLKLVQTIPLPGVEGRIDHMNVDVQGKRLFMAALGNQTVEVVDLAAGKRLQSITGLEEPEGLVYVP
jgi:hypothetical protein